MKRKTIWFLFTASLGVGLASHAQTTAPASIAGNWLTVTVASGAPPFATAGTYQILTSPSGSNYSVLGNAGPLAQGLYSYSRTFPSNGMVIFNDSQNPTPTSALLFFSSSATGTIALTNGAAWEAGSFSATNSGPTAAPALFQPAATNRSFQIFLSGQRGSVYALQSSSDLRAWSPFTNVTLADVTTNLVIASPATSAGVFFRARASGVAFAPDSIAGKTLNVSIASGSPAGVYQWQATTNGNDFSIVGGIGVTNDSGVYTYTKLAPDTALLSYSGPNVGSISQKLVFTSPSAGRFFATNGATFQFGSFTVANGPVIFLGNFSYTADTARGASAVYPANGTAMTLSVTNSAGDVWSLNVPGDALLSSRAISMTPFSSINSGNALLPVSSGVVLGPDGIQFADNVTLSLTPHAPLGKNASLMLAGDDGSALYLVQTTNQSGVYSTSLLHFTSGAATDPSDQQLANLQQEAQAAYNQAVNEARALLHSFHTKSEPPDYIFSCHPNETQDQDAGVDAWVSNLFLDETEAIQHLLSAARTLALTTGNTDDSSALNLALQLVSGPMYNEMDGLWNTWGSNPDKTVPLVRASLSLIRQQALLGGSDDISGGRFTGRILSAMSKLLTHYMDKLRNEHDYSLVPSLLQIERTSELLGGGDDTSFFSQLVSVLTFKLTIDDQLNGGEGHEEAQGDITMTADPALIFPLSGSGAINYVSGTLGGATLAPGQSFTANVHIDDWDACDSLTATIYLDRFGADTEDYQAAGFTVPVPGPMEEAAVAVFTGHLTDNPKYGGLYAFSVPLQNKNPEAISQTVVGNGQGGNVTVQFTLLHTPK